MVLPGVHDRVPDASPGHRGCSSVDSAEEAMVVLERELQTSIFKFQIPYSSKLVVLVAREHDPVFRRAARVDTQLLYQKPGSALTGGAFLCVYC